MQINCQLITIRNVRIKFSTFRSDIDIDQLQISQQDLRLLEILTIRYLYPREQINIICWAGSETKYFSIMDLNIFPGTMLSMRGRRSSTNCEFSGRRSGVRERRPRRSLRKSTGSSSAPRGGKRTTTVSGDWNRPERGSSSLRNISGLFSKRRMIERRNFLIPLPNKR